MPHPPAPELQAYFQQHGVQEVECIFPDVSGYPRGKLMPATGNSQLACSKRDRS